MKKLSVLLLVICGLACANSSYAQRIGVYLGYGSEIETLGIGANGEFMLNDKLGIAPGLTFFFPRDEGNFKFTWFEFNGNLNYYFLNQGSVGLYGLGGLNFTSVKVKYDFLGSSGSDSATEVGLNLGLGANFDIGKSFTPFSELKFVIGDADQVCIFFGAKFNIGK